MSEETTRNMGNQELRLILARLDSIDGRLSSLEQKEEARAYDTKPMWERALAEIMETRAAVVKVEERLGNIESDIRLVRRMLRTAFAEITRAQDDLEERIEVIEEFRPAA
jgi:chromosome segregation ATPase